MGRFRQHLTYRLLAPLVLGYVFTLAIAFALIENQAAAIQQTLIQHRASELAETFLLAVASNSDDTEINRVILSMGTFSDVDKLFVLDDTRKTILAASSLRLADKPIDIIADPALRNRLLDAAISNTNLFVSDASDLHYFSYKLPLFARNSAALRDLTFLVQIREHAVAKINSENAGIMRVGVAFSLAVLIVLVFLLVRRLVLRPLLNLSQVIDEGKATNMPVLAEYADNDEIGALIQTYNQMILAQHERQIELQKAQQESEAAARSKSNFLSTMTHEIRTPLNGVLGLNQLLRQTDLNRDQAQYVNLIDSSGKQLLAIVNDILDFSRMEADKLTLSLIPLDIRLMMKDIYAIFKLTANEKQIELEMHLPASMPHVLADGVRIRQILMNLIGNALKFTRQGRVAITVAAQTTADDKLSLCFQIQDTGIGIKPEDQSRLFEKFTQADSSIVREFGGSGLGLSICRQLISLMAGELRVDSEFGRGSNFYVDLVLPVLDIKSVVTASEITQVKSTQAAHILIAEDTAVNRMILEKMLLSQGHTVTSVADGKQAVEMAQQQHFDIILMDCQMPVMDGMVATREIRKFNAHIPIVAVTAGVTEEIRLDCSRAGMNDYLTKPINFPQVTSTINHWLELANTQQQSRPATGA